MSYSLEPISQTVFLVDDDSSVCEALGDLFESAGLGVRSFGSAEDFLEHWSSAMAGCLVLDVRLPGLSGLELQGKLTEAGLSIPIIIMTGHGDIPMVRKALKAGAIEFLTKPFQDEELLGAIRQAFAADRARRQAEHVEGSLAIRYETLSERERQVMELVTDGMMNKEIADELHLSIVTVKLYRRQVMVKMQADSLADLVRMRERIKSSRL
jgi:FixJ family two-component response regulator